MEFNNPTTAGKLSDLRGLTSDPDKFYMTVLTTRPWVNLFAVRLEHEHYPPRTERNKIFDYMLVKWPEGPDEMLWAVLGIPLEDRPIAERLAKELQLRIADGVPSIISGGNPPSQIWFPVDPHNRNIWNLENNPRPVEQDGNHRRSGFESKGGSPFLFCDEDQRKEESRLIEEIINADQDERFLGKFKNPDFWVKWGAGRDSDDAE